MGRKNRSIVPAGLLYLIDAIPSHKWLGYCQLIARRAGSPLRPERNLCSHPPPHSPAPSGRHIPVLAHGHQTELETLFDFEFYNHAAPSGAPVCESQWDSNPSAQGWRSAPAGKERLFWETVPTNSSTLKALHQIHRRPAATPSELFSFCPFPQRSRCASTLG